MKHTIQFSDSIFLQLLAGILMIFLLMSPVAAQSLTVTLVSSSVSQKSLQAGSIQTFKAAIKSSMTVQKMIADIRIMNSARQKISNKSYDSFTMNAGVNFPLQFDYQSLKTLPAGNYTIELGVWDTAWKTYLYETVTPFTVTVPQIAASVSLVNSSVSLNSVTAGQTQIFKADIKSATAMQNMIADIRIMNSSKVKVVNKYFDNFALTANVLKTLQFDYKTDATLPPGNYTVEVGVWDNVWNTYLYETVTPFTVTVPQVAASVSLVNSSVSLNSVTAGQTQIFKADIKSATAMQNMIADIRIMNSSKVKVVNKYFDNFALTANVLKPLQFDYKTDATLPPGNYTVEVGVWDNVWNTYLYETVTPFTVTATSAPVPLTPPVVVVSPPVVVVPPVVVPVEPAGNAPAPILATLTNLALNPGFENDSAAYNVDGWTNWFIDTTQPRSGKKALRIAPNGGLGTLFLGNQLIPGQSYRASVFAKIAAPAESAQFGLNMFNSSGVQVFNRSVAITSTNYQQYTIDFTVPADFREAAIFFYKHEGAASIYADDIEVVQTANVPAPFYARPSAAPAAGVGYAFGSRKVPYVAGIKVNNVTTASQDTSIQKLYNEWKAKLSPRCGGQMVVFSTVAGKYAAVSEGISYGMMITAIMAGYDPQARTLFDGLFKFARQYPAYGKDPNLMDWAVTQDCKSAGGGWNAVDGDLDIAMALLLADKQWGSAGSINYMAEAIKTINAMKLGDFLANGLVGGRVHRNSDNMIGHFRAFKKATGDVFWDLAVKKGFEMLTLGQSFSPVGLIPGIMIGIRENNIRPSVPYYFEGPLEGFYDWNSNRIPWRLATDYVTSGDSRSQVIALKLMNFLRTASGGNPAMIAAGYELDGKVIWQYPSQSFVGPATAGALVDPNNQAFLNTIWAHTASTPLMGYYDSELQILSMIVASGNWWQP